MRRGQVLSTFIERFEHYDAMRLEQHWNYPTDQCRSLEIRVVKT